jgi:hypothetical protein
LPQIVLTLNSTSSLASSLNRRQEQTDQRPNDRNNNHQLHEGKCEPFACLLYVNHPQSMRDSEQGFNKEFFGFQGKSGAGSLLIPLRATRIR